MQLGELPSWGFGRLRRKKEQLQSGQGSWLGIIPRRKSRVKRIGFILAAVALAGIASAMFLPAGHAANGFVRVQGKYLVSLDGSRLILRGVNLGNWLVPEGYMFGFAGGPQSPREIQTFINELIGPAEAERFWREYRERYITEDDVRFISRTGINSVRIPLHYKFFLSDQEEGFRLLDQVVGWAAKYHLYVILDLHCAPDGQTGANIDDSWGYPWLYESEADQELTIEVWKGIASHYSSNTTVIGYDLLNEPIPHFPELRKYNLQLEPLYKRITAGIRTVDQNHIVVLGVNNSYTLPRGFTLPRDCGEGSFLLVGLLIECWTPKGRWHRVARFTLQVRSVAGIGMQSRVGVRTHRQSRY
jgi:Cellulase (glycosyl hydrolase family 5)